MNPLRVIVSVNHIVAGLLRWLLIADFLVLVCVVLWGVASRYLFGHQAAWTEELARLLMIWLALLGSAWVCREDGHLGMDVVVRTWTEDARHLGRLSGTLLVFIFAGSVMAWGGWQLVCQRFASGQMLPALGISRGWFYVVLPLSGCAISLFMLESLWTGIRRRDVQGKESGTA